MVALRRQNIVCVLESRCHDQNIFVCVCACLSVSPLRMPNSTHIRLILSTKATASWTIKVAITRSHKVEEVWWDAS